MIVGKNLAAILRSSCSEKIVHVINDFILESDCSKYSHGDKAYLQNNLVAIFLEAGSGQANKALLEAHRKFFDVHYTISGIDCIVSKPVKDCVSIHEPYNETQDYILYNELPDKMELIEPGNFCMIPNKFAHMAFYDIHNVVRKFVFKIPAELDA